MTNKKIEKGALITTIILLVIFVPLSCLSMYFHIKGTPKTEENINHEFHFNNKLWFYSSEGTLLGSYNCETEKCDYANYSSEDQTYSIDSLKFSDTKSSSINDTFAFLTDGTEDIFLYNFKTNLNFKTNPYKIVNNYNVGIEGSLYIVKNKNDKYGVIELQNNAIPVIPFNYDYIGLKNELDENGHVIADYFIVKKDDNWLIIDQKEAKLTEDFQEEIISYTGKEIITKNNDYYHLKNYQNENILTDDFSNLSFTGKYLNCTTLNNEFYVYDVTTNTEISDRYSTDSDTLIKTIINDANNLEIYIDDNLVETVLL